MATFIITDAVGTVLAYATVPARGSSLSDGRTIQSLDPRSKNTATSFQEPERQPPAHALQQLGVAATLDGLEVRVDADGKWTLEHSLAPARKITETFFAWTDIPPDSRADPVKVTVSCERLVLHQEKLSGTLPSTGSTYTENLPQNRVLTVTVRH